MYPEFQVDLKWTESTKENMMDYTRINLNLCLGLKNETVVWEKDGNGLDLSYPCTCTTPIDCLSGPWLFCKCWGQNYPVTKFSQINLNEGLYIEDGVLKCFGRSGTRHERRRDTGRTHAYYDWNTWQWHEQITSCNLKNPRDANCIPGITSNNPGTLNLDNGCPWAPGTPKWEGYDWDSKS
ncbi:hypothetical protein B0T20DRAFT_4530 [Sordaria brevicollis]|uniref:Uncharacterized protein n=1 Tax=Sordaria brevicollis TaxID=83679 RepID=A0AAE0UFW1_SORBR|nr:hypothetical protein B0T20DRAFT_4530 [Sordaria brevicollis]